MTDLGLDFITAQRMCEISDKHKTGFGFACGGIIDASQKGATHMDIIQLKKEWIPEFKKRGF